MSQNEIIKRNEEALKKLRSARKSYKLQQSPENKRALKSALVEWVNAHDDFRKLQSR